MERVLSLPSHKGRTRHLGTLSYNNSRRGTVRVCSNVWRPAESAFAPLHNKRNTSRVQDAARSPGALRRRAAAGPRSPRGREEEEEGGKAKGKKINDKAVRSRAYSLNMKIEEGKEAAARADIDKILEMAKSSDSFTTEPLLVMLRSASLKLQSTLRDREKKAARDAERKRKQQEKWGSEAKAKDAAPAGPVFTKDQRNPGSSKAR